MAPAKNSSTFARVFAPLSDSLWILFLLLSVLLAPVWAFDIGEAQIRTSIRARELQAALLWLASIVDVLWVGLAAVVVYLSTARNVGLNTARRWALIVLIGSWLVAALSAWRGLPLGPIHFTSRFGPLLGPVSLGWLLLWCVCVFGARDLAASAFPRLGHLGTALCIAILLGLTDLSLEPFASKTRAWWLWIEKAPRSSLAVILQSSMTWALGGFALAWLMRAPILSKPAESRFPRGACAFVILHVMLVLAHLGRAFRS